jgi:H+-transporting ATPase
VGALVKVGISLGAITLAELFGLLSLGMKYLGLKGNISQLHTFVFAALLYMGLFTVLIVRERTHFWNSRPSRSLLFAVAADMTIVAALVTIGIPSVKPIPVKDLLFLFSYVAFFSLIVNDFVKCRVMKRFGVTV